MSIVFEGALAGGLLGSLTGMALCCSARDMAAELGTGYPTKACIASALGGVSAGAVLAPIYHYKGAESEKSNQNAAALEYNAMRIA